MIESDAGDFPDWGCQRVPAIRRGVGGERRPANDQAPAAAGAVGLAGGEDVIEAATLSSSKSGGAQADLAVRLPLVRIVLRR